MSAAASAPEHFARHAAAYAVSDAHRNGPSLPALLELAAPDGADDALDVATGAGHTALALAAAARSVVAIDLAEPMLEQGRRRAEVEQVRNVRFTAGDAQDPPFPDAAFDLVSCRHAPHHFADPGAFLREAARVLRPGGRLVIADQISPDAGVRPFIDRWERTRDPSHAGQRTIAEWRGLAEAAGLRWTADRLVTYRLEFDAWVATAGCSAAQVAELEAIARAATTGERDSIGLDLGPDGRPAAFHLPVLVARLEPHARTA